MKLGQSAERQHSHSPQCCQAPAYARLYTWNLQSRATLATRWTYQASSLRTFIRNVDERAGHGQAALLHNDPHYGNVLCSTDSRPRCVGVLDLEAAMTGPPESDVAHAELLHGPLFGHPLANPWSEWLREGYGCALDPVVLLFYRAYHLLNLGWHAAFTGDVRHAADLELELREVVRQLAVLR